MTQHRRKKIEKDDNLSEQLEKLQGERDQEKARAEENLASFKRSQADFINYKRRTDVEKAASVGFGKSLAFLSILPVLDDITRALAAVPEHLADEPWAAGMALIEKKFRKILENEGVTPMKTVGESFDPAFHEAVLRCPGEEGIIVEELLTGYMYKDKVLRQAQVKVACEDITE